MTFTFDGAFGSPKKKPSEGWLSGDEAMARYAKAPDSLTTAVERERADHLKCATEAKPLRVDVERILDSNVCYLEFKCGGCGLDKRIQLNEKTGVVIVISGAVPKALTKDEKITANVKANAEGRRYPQIYMPQVVPRDRDIISKSEIAKAFSVAASAEMFIVDDPDWEMDGEKKASAKPLVSGGGKIMRKPEAKAPVKSLMDRLRIVRAAPVHDEEV